MPFRAPPPAQHPSVLVRPTSPTASSPALQQRSPTTPPPLGIVTRHHATLRLPKPPPPPKPLYLTTRLGHNKIATEERWMQVEEEEEQSRASIGRKERGKLPNWQRSSVAEDPQSDGVAEAQSQTGESSPPAAEEARSESSMPFTGTLMVERATEPGGSQSDGSPPETPSSHSLDAIQTTASHRHEPGELDASLSHWNKSREPSVASSTVSNGIFHTPVGTFRLERLGELDDGRRYSTIRFRDEEGQLNIFFDPRLHNPFAPDQQDVEPPSPMQQSTPTETGVALPDLPAVSTETELGKVVTTEALPEPPTLGNGLPVASLPPLDDSTLLPLPAQSLPALALHAFSGLTECGELSFDAGEELRIEVEDGGGGWSLGCVAREGEAGRGLIPRAWFAYVEATSLPSQPEFAGETIPNDESDYATRSIRRHVVVSGTEFEPTWFARLLSPRKPPSSTLGAPSTSTIPASLVSQAPSPTSVLRISDTPGISGSFLPRFGLPSPEHFGSALLSVVGSAFSFSLPFSFGGIVVPGASILAATSAPTFKRDTVTRAPRLPRPECDWKAAKRQDSKTLLHAWIEEGDEFDNDLTDVTQTWDVADGPAWQRAHSTGYRVSVHDPVVVNTASERLHVSYTVSTRFDAAVAESPEEDVYAVARRFSDFVALDDLLRMRFFHPLVIVAPLPTKGEVSFPSTRTDPTFLARRARLLTDWLTDLCRHPVLGESEELKGFLVIEKREELARHLLTTLSASTGPPQPLFPARVYHPAFNVDAQDATVLATKFEQDCIRAADKQLLGLDNAARNAAAAMQKQLDSTAQLISCALEALSERPYTLCASQLERKSVQEWQSVARNLLGTFPERDESTKAATDRLVERHRHLASDYTALLDMHRIILAKFEHLSHEAERDATLLSERSSRCETLLNITCAELNRVIGERQANIAVAAREMLLQATEQQEESMRMTRSAFSLFAADARRSTTMQPSQDEKDQPPAGR